MLPSPHCHCEVYLNLSKTHWLLCFVFFFSQPVRVSPLVAVPQLCVNSNYLPVVKGLAGPRETVTGKAQVNNWWVNEPLIAWRLSELPPLWRRNGTCYQLFQERFKLRVLIKCQRVALVCQQSTLWWENRQYATHTHTHSSFSSDCIKYLVSPSDAPRINSRAAAGAAWPTNCIKQNPQLSTHSNPLSELSCQCVSKDWGACQVWTPRGDKYKKHSIRMNSPIIRTVLLVSQLHGRIWTWLSSRGNSCSPRRPEHSASAALEDRIRSS